jgi:hypothetical protein
MESFEVIVKGEYYKIVRFTAFEQVFSVINYATCHIIRKNENGEWVTIEHRFGKENPPLREIGRAIDARLELA